MISRDELQARLNEIELAIQQSVQTAPPKQPPNQSATHPPKQSARGKPFRLPDKATFNLTYSAGSESWTGTLTVGEWAEEYKKTHLPTRVPKCALESGRCIERFMTSGGNEQTVRVESKLRQLQAPTVIMWATEDVFFDKKWAYWLKETIPGAVGVIEVEGAKLFFPEERPEFFADELALILNCSRAQTVLSHC